MFETLVLTDGALIRILRRYAKHLGLSDLMSDATAQVFLQADPGAGNWDRWLRSNCSRCDQSPESCGFFHPTQEQCQGDLTPKKLQMAQLMLIEMNRITRCPLRTEPAGDQGDQNPGRS